VGQKSGPIGVGATVDVATAVGGTGVTVAGGGDGVAVWLVQAPSIRTSKTDSRNLYELITLAFSEPLVFIFLLISLLPAVRDKFRPRQLEYLIFKKNVLSVGAELSG
jgi:hypothetical protein